MFAFEKRALENITALLKNKFPDQVVSVTAFGSAVRGDNSDNSDFDVLVVIKNKTPKLENEILDIFSDENLNSGIQFDPVIKSEISMNREKQHHTPFYTNLQEEGVPL